MSIIPLDNESGARDSLPYAGRVSIEIGAMNVGLEYPYGHEFIGLTNETQKGGPYGTFGCHSESEELPKILPSAGQGGRSTENHRGRYVGPFPSEQSTLGIRDLDQPGD